MEIIEAASMPPGPPRPGTGAAAPGAAPTGAADPDSWMGSFIIVMNAYIHTYRHTDIQFGI